MELPTHLLSENFVKTRKITPDMPFEIQEVNARTLLCPERIDLAAKIAYIEARENGGDMAFARELYRKHIEAFSEGYFVEPGDASKVSLEAFYSAFDSLIDDFKVNGFDSEKSLIPVGEGNILLDGAHRTACAIYFQKTVTVIRFPAFTASFDYRYFRQRRLSEEMLAYMAVIYSRYAQTQLYMACLWPAAVESRRENAVERIREDHRIVLDKTIMLQKSGLRNFMLQIYQHQGWIGTPETHFPGVMGKVDACFVPGVCTEIVLFEGGTLDEVLAMKDSIRGIFQIGKHAIHISDSNEETRLMAELLLNENSLHALNYGKPDTFPDWFRKFKELRSSVASLNAAATASYYGIQGSEKAVLSENLVNPFDPRSYFVFDGVKFPALSVIKDSLNGTDSALSREVNALLRKGGANSVRKRKYEDAKTRFIWSAQKAELCCKQFAMRITQKMGLYEFLHKLHHR